VSPPTEIPRRTIQEVKKLLDQGEKVYFLDVRGHPDENQIKGSVYYNPSTILGAGNVELPVPKKGLIIIYCT
jgi:hypothetical protein